MRGGISWVSVTGRKLMLVISVMIHHNLAELRAVFWCCVKCRTLKCMTLLYPFFPPTQVHICPSSLAALSSVFLSSVSSQASSFDTNFSFNLTTQPSVYYSSCFLHLVNQPAMQQAFFDILCNNVHIFPLSCRPREMRESPSGRNLPLAVSMTTNQSSTPAAARTAHPPGGFGWLVCCVSGLQV